MAVAAPTPRPRLVPFGRMAGPVGLLKEVASRPAGLFVTASFGVASAAPSSSGSSGSSSGSTGGSAVHPEFGP